MNSRGIAVIIEININTQNSDGAAVPVESSCQIESCGDILADSCLQVVLEMTSTTSVHIHSCGNSSMSDERVCQLLQYGAGSDVSCSVNRFVENYTVEISCQWCLTLSILSNFSGYLPYTLSKFYNNGYEKTAMSLWPYHIDLSSGPLSVLVLST